jgi:hypothetical protein
MELTSKKNNKCVLQCATKYHNAELKETDILLTKCKLNYEKNHSGAAKPRISTIQKTKLDTK